MVEFVISSTLDVLFYAALAKKGPLIGLPMLPRSISTPLDSDREQNEVSFLQVLWRDDIRSNKRHRRLN